MDPALLSKIRCNMPTSTENISKGIAHITCQGLRCASTRMRDGQEVPCNQLICRQNANGMIAGCFQCRRCKQIIEVLP